VGASGGFGIAGLPAWLTWALVHIFYLIGFENRVIVLFRWAYSYLTRGRGSRLITQAAATALPQTSADAKPQGDQPAREELTS